MTQVLLLGAGELGTAFLQALSQNTSLRITLAVRSPDNYTQLVQSTNVSTLKLDLSAPAEGLSQTFSHYDIVISATGFGSDPSTVLKSANEALVAGTLKQQRGESRLWFFPWQWGVDYDVTGDSQGLMPLFGAQRDVRDLLRQNAKASNVKWTIVSTGIFMSFLFEPFWGMVDRTYEAKGQITVRCLGSWEHAVTVTDVNDIAKVLHRIVTDDIEFTQNAVVYIAGDTVTYERLADIIERVSGIQVKRQEWSTEYLTSELEIDPNDQIKRYRLVFSKPGVYWDTENTLDRKIGMPMLDVETYAQTLFPHGQAP